MSKKKYIGAELKKLRNKQSLYQYDVAERLGISQKNVHIIEQRKDLLLSTLKKYIDAIGGDLCIGVTLRNSSEKDVFYLDDYIRV